MGRPKGSKNKPKTGTNIAPLINTAEGVSTNTTVIKDTVVKTKAVKTTTTEVKEEKQINHPVISFAKFVEGVMGETSRMYWMKEAKRRGVTLHQVLSLYFLREFGIVSEEVTQYSTKKQHV